MQRGQVQQHCHSVPFCHQKPPGWEQQDQFYFAQGEQELISPGEHQSRAWVPCPAHNSSGAGEAPSKPY